MNRPRALYAERSVPPSRGSGFVTRLGKRKTGGAYTPTPYLGEFYSAWILHLYGCALRNEGSPGRRG